MIKEILFHGRKTYNNIEGCLILGDTYKEVNGDYEVAGSSTETSELHDIIERYGAENVKIVVQ